VSKYNIICIILFNNNYYYNLCPKKSFKYSEISLVFIYAFARWLLMTAFYKTILTLGVNKISTEKEYFLAQQIWYYEEGEINQFLKLISFKFVPTQF